MTTMDDDGSFIRSADLWS